MSQEDNIIVDRQHWEKSQEHQSLLREIIDQKDRQILKLEQEHDETQRELDETRRERDNARCDVDDSQKEYLLTRQDLLELHRTHYQTQ